jgi:rare lipoprotein A
MTACRAALTMSLLWLCLCPPASAASDDGSAVPSTLPWSWRVSVERAPAVQAHSGWATVVTQAPRVALNPIPRAPPRTLNPLTGQSHVLNGIASYYWQDQMTATGEVFDRTAMTAAHKTLPLHSRVRVTNEINGRSVIVRINDRGPYKPGRVIDMSQAAAGALDMEALGLVPVRIELLSN